MSERIWLCHFHICLRAATFKMTKLQRRSSYTGSNARAAGAGTAARGGERPASTNFDRGAVRVPVLGAGVTARLVATPWLATALALAATGAGSCAADPALAAVPGTRLLGEAREKSSVLSFVMEGVHPHDVGTILDTEGIAVRTGQHCAQPIMDRYGVPATVRASIGLYNTRDDVDAFIRGLHKVREVFG